MSFGRPGSVLLGTGSTGWARGFMSNFPGLEVNCAGYRKSHKRGSEGYSDRSEDDMYRGTLDVRRVSRSLVVHSGTDAGNLLS